MMLDALLRRHNDPKPGSTLPQAERSGTPGGVGAMGSIDDGMGRHPCHGRHLQFWLRGDFVKCIVGVPTKPLSRGNRLGTIHLH